ncbi:MAG: hypothetical protein A2286_01950 [Gammaproteobacteria bacterium RIFOXYA12_FULL_61_12]|nr:MAG: hypothetical protein A2286_01950 [Gammaproteobacteria bacterium RIFOXYA12_FULL_61_12]
MSLNDQLYFWDQASIAELPGALPVMMGQKISDFRGAWPGHSSPTMDELRNELSKIRLCCARWRTYPDGGVSVDILAGRLLIPTSLVMRDAGPRLFLVPSRGITPVKHREKSSVLRGCARIRVSGISLVTGAEMREQFEQRYGIYQSGRYVRMIRDAQPVSDDSVAYEKCSGGHADVHDPTAQETASAANLLRQLTEAAHEVEEQAALAEPPFQYIERHAEVHRGNFKQFFRLKLTNADCGRLADKKIGMLERFEPLTGEKTILRVENIAAGTGEIIVSSQRQLSVDDMPPTGELRLGTEPTVSKIRENVIESLSKGRAPNPWLLPIVAGNYHYSEFRAETVTPPPGARPTASQQDAINRATGSPDLFLVLGPPGTGKTTVILAWVRHLVAQGKRVLITSQSNKAVDNVLERLGRDDSIECVRLGQEQKVSSSVHRFLIDNCAAELQRKFLSNVGQALSTIETATDWAKEAERVIARDASIIGRLHPLIAGRDQTAAALAKTEETFIFRANRLANAEKAASAWRRRLERAEGRLFESKGSRRWILIQRASEFIAKSWVFFAKHALSFAERNLVVAASKSKVAQSERDASSTAHQLILTQISAIHEHLQQNLPTTPVSSLPERFHPWRRLGEPFTPVEIIGGLRSDGANLRRLTEAVGRWRHAIGESRQGSLYAQLIASVDVVGATCIGIQTNQAFREVMFDVVIADECGQIQVHDLMVPLARAPKAIMVGDHNQLPPVVTPEFLDALEARYVEDEGLGDKSWFEHLWDRLPENRRSVLDTQFRCPAVISDFISDAFYEGQYHAGAGVKSGAMFSFFDSPLVFIDTSRHRQRNEVSRKTDDRSEVKGNPLETKIVMSVLKQALAENPDIGRDGEIGVIAPYANHVAEIQRALQAALGNDPFGGITLPIRDVVASVDSFQGQERKLIIVALTRCNKHGTVGFLQDWRRINVAMTRTKHQLVLVGDLDTLTKRRDGLPREDEEFKVSMAKLRDHVLRHGQLIDACKFVPE